MDEKTKALVAEGVEIAGKTVLSVIPVGGTLISCVWDSVKANAAQKRFEKWQAIVEMRLAKVEESLDNIGTNELFASTIMRATDIALKTAEDEKREYLANAVYHTTQIPIEEGMLMIYLDFLERYSVWHLQILHFFYNPKANNLVKNCNYTMGSAMEVLSPVFPELCKNTDLVIKIVNDLQMDGLLTTGSYMNTSMTLNGMLASRTTKMGNDFLEYILCDEFEGKK